MTALLVVDDDAQLRAALGRELAAQGFEVSLAASVPEALSALSRQHVDVLLTDLRMSEQDGIDLLREVRHVSRHTRAILMSAFATARDHQTAIDLGAVRVLCKPFTSAELLQAVQQAVECETGFRGSVHGVSLIDLLQMFHFARRSVRIVVGDLDGGSISVLEGEIMHAELEGSVGEDALRALLSRPSGAIRTEPHVESPRTIVRSFQSLLLDVLRQLDEVGADPTNCIDEHLPLELSALDAFQAGADGVDEPVEHLRTKVRGLAPLSQAALIDLDRRSILPLQGQPPLDDAFAAAVIDLAANIERLAPGFTRFEHVAGSLALGLLRCSRGDCFLVITDLLVGRYATVKFRAQIGRMAEIV